MTRLGPMNPSRVKVINKHLIEEYYWAGDYVCYVDHVLQTGKSFDQVVSEYESKS